MQGKGSFIAPKNLELMREEKLNEIQQHIEQISNIAQLADISEEEIIELFKIIFRGEL